MRFSGGCGLLRIQTYILYIGGIDMWILFAFVSATLLGFYDVFKKQSLRDNSVLTVLLLNCLFSSIIFLILLSVKNHGAFITTAPFCMFIDKSSLKYLFTEYTITSFLLFIKINLIINFKNTYYYGSNYGGNF